MPRYWFECLFSMTMLPGSSAKCACADPILKTGLLCQLDCLGAPDFCGQGACEHTLMGKTYSEATVSERTADVAYCTCDFGRVWLKFPHCPPRHETHVEPSLL